ncbi:Hypothetical_protein [Hexamita inflata]|uniref:Hypothetical_protein n=1 Tax=Hexamita inflata TaxID=28002 RepID=A0AA86PXF4_9EUKA|nr:Hypothetical protein HINF_LOCUS33188 [Hexamita inflata]
MIYVQYLKQSTKIQYYITSNADHHPCSLTDPLAFFKKQAEGLQLRENLVDFGLYLASDLVFHFSYRPLFLKYSQNINKFLIFCHFYAYNDLNSIMYCRLLSFLVYIWLKTRQNQYYLINQISKHFSYRPQIQFSYKPFYQQKSKGSVNEHFWGLQVNRGGGLHSRQCSNLQEDQFLYIGFQQQISLSILCLYLIEEYIKLQYLKNSPALSIILLDVDYSNKLFLIISKIKVKLLF